MVPEDPFRPSSRVEWRADRERDTKKIGVLGCAMPDEPCFNTFAGNTTPAMRTLILASTAVRWAAVRTNPDLRYTPEPGCSP
jgi:hypothetical protein